MSGSRRVRAGARLRVQNEALLQLCVGMYAGANQGYLGVS